MSYSAKSKKVEFYTTFFTFYFTFYINILGRDENMINKQVFLMVIQENSNHILQC